MPGKGRPPRRGRARGRAAMQSCGPSKLPSFKKPMTLNSQNAEEVVDWLTQHTPSSTVSNFTTTSSSSSTAMATPRNTSSTTGAPSSLGSEELFSNEFLELSNAQPLLPEEDEGDEDLTPDLILAENTIEMDIMSDEEEVPAAASFCDVSEEIDASEENDDEEIDVLWVPSRREQEEGSSDGETESQRGSRRIRLRRSREDSSQGTVGQQHVSAPVFSRPTHPPLPPMPPTSTVTARSHTSKKSAVWDFFNVCASDKSIVICNECSQKLSLGKPNSHIGTTSMRRHMSGKHKALWEQHLKGNRQTKSHPPSGPASYCSTSALLDPSEPPSTPPSTLTTCSHSQSSATSQVSVKAMFERKKPMSDCHPLARRLTAGLSALLARQLLPYQLVDSEAFRKFVAIGTPQWKVPSRNFFSKKGIPHLYQHVQSQVTASLSLSVGPKVHMTTDAWSSKHGQGRYVTYTAHWVNLVMAGKQGMGSSTTTVELVSPPRIARGSATTSTPPSLSTSSSSSSYSAAGSSFSSSTPVHPQLPLGYSTCQVRRCHAVLGMTCLESKNHTGSVLLSSLQSQADRWLTPHQLQIGKVVCDNGSNLLAALRLGNLTHVPCMAHVLNLIVQRFVSKYPGFQDVLTQSRKVSAHFRRSYTAMARLADIQQRYNMPVRRLISDSQTRWNSTLLMLERLLQQQRAVNEYLFELGGRTGSAQLGIFFPRYWVLMRDACRLMRPFEEVTNMVSRTEGTISDLIPFAFFLERAVRRVTDEAVDQRDEELEAHDFWSESPERTQAPAATQGEVPEVESEEEGGFVEEEEEDQQEQASQGASGDLLGTPGLVRGWGEETVDDAVLDNEEAEMDSSASNLVRMGSFMLSCLLKDPRIKRLKEKDLYWVATLLDPRYKHKVSEMLPTYHKSEKMRHLQTSLQNMLYNAFKGDVTSGTHQHSRGRGASNPATSTPARTKPFGQSVTSDMQMFFCPRQRHNPSGSTLKERLDRQVADYLALTADIDTLRSDEPLDYWVRRLDLWPELSQFAMNLLSCPASSVLSERTFSAAGGIVTEKRTRLGHKSVDYLTFIKMNEGWISEGYCTPEDLF